MPVNASIFTANRIRCSLEQLPAPTCVPLILLITLTIVMPVSIASAVTGTTPLITASVNESVRAELYRGWPLLLEVALLHPEPFADNPSPLLIDSGTAPWNDAVRIEIRDTNDQVQVWSLVLFNITSNTLTLDGNGAGQLIYYLTPEKTAQLALGSYSIKAVLNTTNSTNPQAWKGIEGSVPVELTLRDEPPILTPNQREIRQQLMASYHLFRDDVSQANAAIDALLVSKPDSIPGLSFKSYLLQLEERNFEAERLLSSAIKIVLDSFPDAQEPPVALIHRQTELMKLPRPVVIRSITLQAQSLILVWDSNPGEVYSIEASSDLKTWLPVATDLVADSEFSVWSSAAGSETRFFRIRK